MLDSLSLLRASVPLSLSVSSRLPLMHRCSPVHRSLKTNARRQDGLRERERNADRHTDPRERRMERKGESQSPCILRREPLSTSSSSPLLSLFPFLRRMHPRQLVNSTLFPWLRISASFLSLSLSCSCSRFLSLTLAAVDSTSLGEEREAAYIGSSVGLKRQQLA